MPPWEPPFRVSGSSILCFAVFAMPRPVLSTILRDPQFWIPVIVLLGGLIILRIISD